MTASIAQEAEGHPREMLVGVLAHGHEVGEDLRRVELVGEPVIQKAPDAEIDGHE